MLGARSSTQAEAAPFNSPSQAAAPRGAGNGSVAGVCVGATVSGAAAPQPHGWPCGVVGAVGLRQHHQQRREARRRPRDRRRDAAGHAPRRLLALSAYDHNAQRVAPGFAPAHVGDRAALDGKDDAGPPILPPLAWVDAKDPLRGVGRIWHEVKVPAQARLQALRFG
jgi:hypothetical protein